MARVTEFGRPCFFCFVWANPLYTRSISCLYSDGVAVRVFSNSNLADEKLGRVGAFVGKGSKGCKVRVIRLLAKQVGCNCH